jgi:hypothetical protein
LSEVITRLFWSGNLPGVSAACGSPEPRWRGNPEEAHASLGGKTVKATSFRELMRALNLSETEARELESQEQIVVDQEVARFPKSIH